ncbi:MAG TPA: M28 family peptidase [Gemmatimonadaceae bacterium]|nr:M28 family peptidase [Gemmatimonadaceae bacterium]
MRVVLRNLVPLLVALPLGAQSVARSDVTLPRAISAIREADLKRDLFLLAGDSMRGREAGEVDEMRASMWVAETMRRIGVRPFGEDSSWFQWWKMRRTRIATAQSGVRIGSHALALWKDIVPTNNVALDSVAAAVLVGDGSDTTIDVRGKVAIANLAAPSPASIRTTTNTYQYNYTRAALAAQGGRLVRRGAVAVIMMADSIAETAMGAIAEVQARGTYDVVGGVARFTRNPVVAAGAAGPQVRPAPVFLARRSSTADVAAGQPIEIRVRTETFETPSVNVIGIVRGTDPTLRNEYVLFSSHQDHDGERYEVAGDRIWNGADDNGSTSVALLAIARAWVKQPGKRSALFVFHGAEERGLLGSRYHVAHPVVPLEKIAAVLNGDMIGRNHPDTAALLGSQPPHRNSLELVSIALSANRATSKFVVDSTWDRPSHAEGWYFRSDHVPYAERNVPALFFTTLLHSDYHTPRDEPNRIDYAKLARVTRWMYVTGWIVANAPKPPALDSGFVLR